MKSKLITEKDVNRILKENGFYIKCNSVQHQAEASYFYMECEPSGHVSELFEKHYKGYNVTLHGNIYILASKSAVR